MSFANLKKQSSVGNVTEKLLKQLEKVSDAQASSNTDDRLWKPTTDKTGNGIAVIRFLPEPEGEEMPFVKLWTHGFQGPGGWYIEKSLTTLNQRDPVAEMNRILWNSGIDADKEVARKQKRKLSYYSNIYVVSDPAAPENEGRVALFKYGKKIFDKISSAMKPEFADETPINPFDFWQGANFKLKIRRVEGYPNYDASLFETPSVLFDDDKQLEKIYKQQFSLAEIVDPSQFKTYEQLKERLDMVLGNNQTTQRQQIEEEEEIMAVSQPSSSKVIDEDDSDDTLSYFKGLIGD